MTYDSYWYEKKSHTKALLNICLSGGSRVLVFGDLPVIPFAVGY